MKKQLLFSFVVFIALAIPVKNLFAQDIKVLPEVRVTSSVKVPDKVSTAFSGDFKNAVGPKWYKLNRDFLVKFIQEDMKHNTLYKKNGFLKYDISYGKEKNLPDEVLNSVKTDYKDYAITTAINVKEEGRNIWVINLDGNNKLLIVRWEEGELEEVGNYKKS